MKKEQSKTKTYGILSKNPFSDESPAYQAWEEKNTGIALGLTDEETKNQPNNFKEIPNQKPTRAFAPFYNKEAQFKQWEDILSHVPKKYRFMLTTYMCQLESTLAEGYQVESEDK